MFCIPTHFSLASRVCSASFTPGVRSPGRRFGSLVRSVLSSAFPVASSPLFSTSRPATAAFWMLSPSRPPSLSAIRSAASRTGALTAGSLRIACSRRSTIRIESAIVMPRAAPGARSVGKPVAIVGEPVTSIVIRGLPSVGVMSSSIRPSLSVRNAPAPSMTSPCAAIESSQ